MITFDPMGGHLIPDRFARKLIAGPYTRDDDPPTPSKEPAPDKERGGPLDPSSFNDDRAPPKPMPTKPTPRGIERPDVPMLMRCFAPTRYWTIHVRFPPSRSRSPKPGRAASKTILSFLPAGSASLSIFAFQSEGCLHLCPSLS
jgi:hypothetical protein